MKQPYSGLKDWVQRRWSQGECVDIGLHATVGLPDSFCQANVDIEIHYRTLSSMVGQKNTMHGA